MIAERRQRLGVGLIVALVWALAPPAAPAASQAVPPWAEPPEALHLTVAEADLAELYGRDPRSNDLLPGSLVHGPTGERHALEGLRFRGSSSRFHPKKSFSIRFAEPQAFLFGSSRMNLKAMYTDPTIMRETLSMAMWAELGRPAPRTKYFDLTVNGVYEGLYLHVERVDFDLIGHAGLPQRGTLVRDEFRDNPALPQSAFGYDLDDTSNPQSLLAANFDSRGDPDWGALEELVRWVHDTPAGPAFASGFRERFDAGVFVDWLAVHEVIGDIDSFADDYWLYLDHDDPAARWHVIPWDKDLAYGSHFRRSHGDTLNDFFAYEHDVERAARRGATCWSARSTRRRSWPRRCARASSTSPSASGAAGSPSSRRRSRTPSAAASRPRRGRGASGCTRRTTTARSADWTSTSRRSPTLPSCGRACWRGGRPRLRATPMPAPRR